MGGVWPGRNSQLTHSPLIGVYGGCFDPPHLGHMALVRAALKLPLEELRVFPVERPVHKPLSQYVTGEQRFKWLQSLWQDDPRVRVMDWEVGIEKPTPTLLTLRRLRQELPGMSPVLIMGSDAFAGFSSWWGYPEHLEHCYVVVYARVGFDPVDDVSQQRIPLGDLGSRQTMGGVVILSDQELPDVSSTVLRESLELGRDVRHLVPEKIYSELVNAYHGSSERL